MMNALRKWYYQQQLQRKLNAAKRPAHAVSFDTSTRVGILFDAGLPNARDLVFDYAESLKQRGKRVDIMGFINDAKRHNNFDFKHFNLKDLTWYGVPKTDVVETFIKQPFDILICLWVGDNPATEWVAMQSAAHLRVGYYHPDKTYCFDLMVDAPNLQQIKDFIDKADRLLKIVNKPLPSRLDLAAAG